MKVFDKKTFWPCFLVSLLFAVVPSRREQGRSFWVNALTEKFSQFLPTAITGSETLFPVCILLMNFAIYFFFFFVLGNVIVWVRDDPPRTNEQDNPDTPARENLSWYDIKKILFSKELAIRSLRTLGIGLVILGLSKLLPIGNVLDSIIRGFEAVENNLKLEYMPRLTEALSFAILILGLGSIFCIYFLVVHISEFLYIVRKKHREKENSDETYRD